MIEPYDSGFSTRKAIEGDTISRGSLEDAIEGTKFVLEYLKARGEFFGLATHQIAEDLEKLKGLKHNV